MRTRILVLCSKLRPKEGMIPTPLQNWTRKDLGSTQPKSLRSLLLDQHSAGHRFPKEAREDFREAFLLKSALQNSPRIPIRLRDIVSFLRSLAAWHVRSRLPRSMAGMLGNPFSHQQTAEVPLEFY